MADEAPKPESSARTAPGVLGAEVANVLRNVYVRPFAGILYPFDPTLRTRGGGWDYQIYERAEEDPRVYAMLQKRKGALAAYPIQLDAASEDPVDVAAKELVERALKLFPFQRVVKDLLDAVMKGFAVDEIMWSVVDGEIMPTGAYRRDQRRFRFGEDYSLRLIDWQNLLLGLPVPDRKFIVHSFDRHDGDPYGRGLGRMLFWKWLFKRQNEASWLIHNEKFASPTVHGKHDPEASEQTKEALLASCSAVALETAIITDSNTEIELLEAEGRGAGDTYAAFKDSQNDDITEIVLGATFTAASGGLDGASGADADTDDRLELAKSDAGDLAETLNGTLVKWIVELNLPAARPPTLRWLIDAEEDLTARAAIDDKIRTWGYKPTLAYVQEKYGGEWVEAAAPPAPDPFAQDSPAPASFAEGSTPPGVLAVSAFAQRGTDQVRSTIDGWVGQVRQLMGQAGSIEELRDRLIELYPSMSGAMFAEVMSEALQVGDLAGRYEAGRGR
ncbi:MAG TPA: DUF935 family protein [Aliidongia sp.]|nr:DUF935 family protein [Aliidongia sp.]